MDGHLQFSVIPSLNDGFGELSLVDRIARIRAAVPGRIVFTTSFGMEDQAITHAILTQDLEIAVVTLDTGRLFPETYALWSATEERYGRRITAFVPNHDALESLVRRQGINGFYGSVANRKACCDIRKVEPLGRALAGADAWMTGLRAEQSDSRAGLDYFSVDEGRGLIKANPLLDWSRRDLVAYVRKEGIPYNSLHDAGYPSIGCQPCTRAVQPGEPERAGRWWWEDKSHKECGLHVTPDGRLVRTAAPGGPAATQNDV
ncbi:MAG: phosphoadenylyl-sulfate reductase [Alphaproteobacteria bacterium]